MKKTAMKSNLDWKARRDGRFYCAPACGGRCTWAAYQAAKKHADALVKKLGVGWKPRVWENLGWHWQAVHSSNCISVSASGKEYMSFVGHNLPGSRWFGYGKTPQLAIAAATRPLLKELADIRRLVEKIERAEKRVDLESSSE